MNFLMMQGRIGRAQFLSANLLPFILWILALLAALTPLKHVLGRALAAPGMVTVLFGLILFLFLFWVFIASQICRLHDIGQTGLWVLLNMIPGVNLLMFLFLLFSKGEDSANRFGMPPLMS